MSFLNGKVIEKIVVPVECCAEQGTAFFIGKRQLMTARHVVREHFSNPASPEPIYIKLGGVSILCNAVDLKGNADIALLTIDKGENYNSSDWLILLKDEFVKDLELRVYGYPQEVAMGVNLVDLAVTNRLEISGWNDRAVARKDVLHLLDYEGLSGSPVVNNEGRVIGTLTIQTNETLGYLSVKKMSSQLTYKGVAFAEDWHGEDNTTFGQGRSTEICQKAIAGIGDRYMKDLPQPNNHLESRLNFFSDKKSIDEHTKNRNDLIAFLNGLDQTEQKRIRGIYGQQQLELKRFCRYAMANRFKNILPWEKEIELNTLVRKLMDDHAFNYLDGGHVKNMCLVGKAGSGKTHSLCEFASHKQQQANIYLFFGTEFVVHESITEQVRAKVCEDKSFQDIDIEMRNRGRYAVIVIDALNEGLGCTLWNNHLGALRDELNKYDNIKLIISVRSPFDQELNDLSRESNIKKRKEKWEVVQVVGFEDKNKAIEEFFKAYGVPESFKKKYLEAFGNPLFLKIFCETYRSLTPVELENLTRLIIYKKYVKRKNEDVSHQVDEDIELNIADSYLMKLANYSVFTAHFNTISREKARAYAREMCPGRLWSQDLLNAMLSSSLLLSERTADGDSAVMFEYENFGDYYKAEQLIKSKMNEDEALDWLLDQKRFFDRHKNIASNKFENAIMALFDCWTINGVELQNKRIVQQQDFLREHYIEYLMASDMDYNDVLDRLEELDPRIKQDLEMVRKPQSMTLQEVMEVHEHLKAYETVGSRDLVWTNYVNNLFVRYQDSFIGTLPCEIDPTLLVDDEEKKYLIRLVWMLATAHPLYRALIMRKLRKLLAIHSEMMLWLIDMFKDVNDPYVLQGLYCATAGVLLPSRDRALLNSVAAFIYKQYYENPASVPQDLIVRQWTLKIIERAYIIDNNCDWWTKIITPFEALSFDEKVITPIENIHSDYFGLQHGSQLLYNSIFGFSDFNRYIIGTNNRNTSTDYFVFDEISNTYVGDNLSREQAEIAYYVKFVFGWNDKLGFLDNGKYSAGRFENETERMGKKMQWLAWYRLNARMMDSYKVTKSTYHYSDTAEEKDFTKTPYPWNTSEITLFDPTLDVEGYRKAYPKLQEMVVPVVAEVPDDEWIQKGEYVPTFRHQVTVDDKLFIMLYGFDRVAVGNKITFVITNAAFVKKADAEQFEQWSKEQNFYGRWMPERNGMYDFLWNDYPLADAYKNSIETEVWERPSSGCPCDVMLSYAAQLQEHWEGINRNDEYLTTVFMPCEEMMLQQKLYCSEVRGIIRREEDDSIVAINGPKENGLSGLFVRKDILDEYLMRNGYVLFYYIVGEKQLQADLPHSIMKDMSAAYKYELDGNVTEIQHMRVIEREIPEEPKANPARREELAKKNKEQGLSTREMIEWAELMNLEKEDDEEEGGGEENERNEE